MQGLLYLACCSQRSESSQMILLYCKVKQLFRATAAWMLEGTFQGSNQNQRLEWIFYAGEDSPLNSLYTGLSRSIVQTNQPTNHLIWKSIGLVLNTFFVLCLFLGFSSSFIFEFVSEVCRSKLIINVGINNHILLLLYRENIYI